MHSNCGLSAQRDGGGEGRAGDLLFSPPSPTFNVRRFFGKEPYSSFQHIQGGQYPYHLGTAEIRAEEKKSSLLDEGWVGEEGARGSWAGVARSSQGCYSLLISDYVFLTSPPELSQEAYTLLKLDLRFFESTCGTTNTPCSSASLLRSAPPFFDLLSLPRRLLSGLVFIDLVSILLRKPLPRKSEASSSPNPLLS